MSRSGVGGKPSHLSSFQGALWWGSDSRPYTLVTLSLEHKRPNHIQGLSLGCLNHPGPQWNVNSLVEDWQQRKGSPAYSYPLRCPRAQVGLSPLSVWDDRVGLCIKVLENCWACSRGMESPFSHILWSISVSSPRNFISIKRHDNICTVWGVS